MTTKVLLQHTDRFCLYKNARKGRQNGRNYLLSAVKSMFENAETQEGLKLGELYGYYGHGRRQLAGLDVPETAVVMVEGRPVLIDNVPGCRTVHLSIDDEGIITHTQEIFDNEPGRIIAGLLESRAGGWSWATSGKDGTVSIPTRFFGMDYVKNPNFVSLDHPAYMNESADEQEGKLLESLQSRGFTEAGAKDVASHFHKIGEQEISLINPLLVEEAEIALLEARGEIIDLATQLDEEKAKSAGNEGMLEGLKTEHAAEIQALQTQLQESHSKVAARDAFLDDMLKSLPVFVTETQREAFRSMDTPEDLKIVKGMFEGLRRTAISTLPIDRKNPPAAEKTTAAEHVPTISFKEPNLNF